MSYGKYTKFFRLPYMEAGDILNEADEAKRANTIDGLLYVATFGSTNAIIVDGEYELNPVSETNYSLVISSANSVSISENEPVVFIAIVNGYLAYRTEEITVSNLTQGEIWKIYAVYNSDMIGDPTQVSVFATSDEIDDSGYLLLATVDFSNDDPILDYSSDKLMYANLSQHSLTTTNPHGNNLTQTNLNVTQNFSIASNKIYPYVILNVDLDGENNTDVLFSSIGISPQFVTIMGDSSGIGVTIDQSESKVVFSCGTSKSIKVKIEGDPL